MGNVGSSECTFKATLVANGYLRLALFVFGSPSLLLNVDKIIRLRRIVSFVASVYAPMFMRVHLKPRAVIGSGNMIYLRELLLCYQQCDEELFSAAVKKCFLSHAASWLNPTNVALNVHSDDPPFFIAALQSSQQSLPMQTPTQDNYVVGSKTYEKLFRRKQKSSLCCIARATILESDRQSQQTLRAIRWKNVKGGGRQKSLKNEIT